MRLAILLLLMMTAMTAVAESLRLAVASNFRPALAALAPEFTRTTGIELVISSGASGQLATQILQGAPFDIFLSADDHYPARLHSRLGGDLPRTYALGQLWLVSRTAANDWQSLLRKSDKIALANPALAPYGAAADTLMQSLAPLSATRVTAANIAQVRQWYDAGHINTAWLAGSLVPADAPTRFNLTAQLLAPIRQQLLVLKPSPRSRQFITFLLNPDTQRQLQPLGYDPVNADD